MFRGRGTRRSALAALLMGGALLIAPAQASFPGQNGKIAFERGRDVWTMNPDGSGATALTTGGGTLDPAWAPGAQQIAFTRGGDIWVMNADGSGQRNLTGALGTTTEQQPTWSPDGMRIAFSRFVQGAGGYRIWAINVNGTSPVQLTGIAGTPSSGDFSPAWSPGGSEIAFTRANNSTDIWTVDASGSGSEVAYAGSPSSPDDNAAWAPDGSAIAFTTNRGGGNDIYKQVGRGGAGTPVTGNAADDNNPAWSPDGTRIAFASTRAGGTKIWSVGSGGVEQGPVDLSGTAATDSAPDWGQVATQPSGELGPPAIGKTLNAVPVKGTVLVQLPPGSGGSVSAAGVARPARFIPLQEAQQLPIGTTFDTSRGTVKLSFGLNKISTKTQSGTFNGGRFVTRQSQGNPLTELRLTGGSLGRCSKKPSGGAASARSRSRSLFSNARGRFRTRGRNSVATVRGTKWLTKDTCSGTLTVVRRGTVVVRDLVKRRNIVVRKGKRYFAKAPR